MARLLVRLKLRLLANALRASTSAKVSFILSTTWAVIVAAGLFAILASLRGKADAVALTTVIFTALTFGWLILPVISFGLDTTLDPAMLTPYPLRTRPLAVSLLAASAVGPWPAANLVGLLGAVVGLASGSLGVLVGLAAAALQLLFCITLARFVTTSMARLLRSRRGRDLAVFIFVPIVAGYEIVTQVVPRAAAEGKLTPASFAGVDAWMRWLPPGLAAHAIVDASDGRAGAALARLALLAAVVAVLGWLWIRSLGRALVTPDKSTQSAGVRGAALPFARFGLRGTFAARFWVYQRRDPPELAYWGIVAVIMVAVSISTILSPDGHPAVLLASSVFGAAFVGNFHANAIGASGPAFVAETAALTGERSLRAYLSGLNISLGVVAAPLLVVVSLGLAALDRRPGYGVLAIAVDLAGLGAALGLAGVFSVAAPYPMTKRTGTPMRVASDGFAVYGLVGTFGILFGVAIAVVPVIVAAALTSGAPALARDPALVACAAGYGLALAWAGVRIGARVARYRLPEICQVAIRSRL